MYGEGCLREDDTTMARSGGDGGSSGSGGVGYGRSMKEYEDQLSNLKKENFNLKLRIFFLEERMGVSSADNAESAVKTNVELQVGRCPAFFFFFIKNYENNYASKTFHMINHLL